MALIKCKECGKEFSDKASACPNCACPITKLSTKNENSIFQEKEETYKEYSTGNNSIKSFISKHKVLIIIGSIILFISFVYFMAYVEEEKNRQKVIEESKNKVRDLGEDLKKINDELECAEEIERKMDENGNINYYSVSRECRYLIDRFAK